MAARNGKTAFILLTQFMRIFLLTIVLSQLLNGCNAQSFLKISKALSKKQKDKSGTLKGFTFHQIREKLMGLKEAEFLNSEFDTLFLLEKFSLESGTYYGKIWSKHESISYSYSNNVFDFTNKSIFTNYTSFLIGKWDTIGIREQEKKYSDMIPQHIIFASFINKNGSSYDIQTINFKEFFNIDRDRFGIIRSKTMHPLM